MANRRRGEVPLALGTERYNPLPDARRARRTGGRPRGGRPRRARRAVRARTPERPRTSSSCSARRSAAAATPSTCGGSPPCRWRRFFRRPPRRSARRSPPPSARRPQTLEPHGRDGAGGAGRRLPVGCRDGAGALDPALAPPRDVWAATPRRSRRRRRPRPPTLRRCPRPGELDRLIAAHPDPETLR